jgi:hypothetical protein
MHNVCLIQIFGNPENETMHPGERAPVNPNQPLNRPDRKTTDTFSLVTRELLIRHASILLIVLISCIFSYKYLVMFSHYPLLVTANNKFLCGSIIESANDFPLTITFLYGVLLLFSTYTAGKYSKIVKPGTIRIITLAAITIYLSLTTAAILYTDQTQISVDRWSVITAFWDAVHNGTFPYLAKSHLDCYPGPSPFYFVIAYPYYLIGDIGFLSITGCLLLFILLSVYYKNSSLKYMAITLIFFSVCTFWENISRSTVITTSTLIAAYMAWATGGDKTKTGRLIGIGLLGGLLFSTRSVYIIAFLILYCFLFLQNKNYRDIITVAIFFITAFSITLLPLAIWDFSTFIEFNPFTLQASLAGHEAILTILLLSLAAGVYASNEQEVYFSTGLLIIFVVTINLVKSVTVNGFSEAYFGNKGDISYLILSIPFLVLSMGSRNTAPPTQDATKLKQ